MGLRIQKLLTRQVCKCGMKTARLGGSAACTLASKAFLLNFLGSADGCYMEEPGDASVYNATQLEHNEIA